MMTRDCGRSHRLPFLVRAAGVFIGLLLISAATLTPSIALAKSVAAQPVHVRTAIAPHQFPSVASRSSPWHSSQGTK